MFEAFDPLGSTVDSERLEKRNGMAFSGCASVLDFRLEDRVVSTFWLTSDSWKSLLCRGHTVGPA